MILEDSIRSISPREREREGEREEEESLLVICQSYNK